jgi:hypothetical protein
LFKKSAKQDLPELGEILLSLTYLPSAGRLNLDVLRAKQLLQTDIVGGAGLCPMTLQMAGLITVLPYLQFLMFEFR